MSARKLVQRPRARRDILSIVAFVAAHNPTAARALLDAYQQALVTLRAYPEARRQYVPNHAALRILGYYPFRAISTTCSSAASMATRSTCSASFMTLGMFPAVLEDKH